MFTCKWKPLLPMALLAIVLVVASGCGGGPEMVPVSGKVLFNGKPLKFGSVSFQPLFGDHARGRIQADGSFKLSTLGDGDGATIGENLVRVTCYEAQKSGLSAAQGNQEPSLGKSLIPLKYTKYGTSGLKVVVEKTVNEPVVIQLNGE